MAEAVGSAVLSEAVTRTVTSLLGKMERMEQRDCMERLEMAHIKMEAAVEASNRWLITDAPLLRWRKKLKCAAQECDDTLRRCKQRAVEDEAKTEQLRRAYLPARVAHATKSFISALILAPGTDDDGEQARSTTVRRFERHADGAEEFLRFVHLGGTPLRRPYAFSNPLVGQLMAGEFLHYQMLRGGRYRHFHVRTVHSPDRGIEATVSLVYADTMAPMESFYVFMVLRLTESVDIIGTAVRTVRSTLCRYRPATINAVMTELTQLPTQDFHWSRPAATISGQKESDGLHRAFVQRFRPDPLCCMDDHGSRCIVPEPVIRFSLQGLVSPPAAPGLPPLKLHTYIMPHDDSPIPMDLQLPAHECCAAGLIGAEEEHLHVAHANIGLDELDEVLLPKAIEYLHRSTEATAYNLVWKSKHGTAHVYLEKITPPVVITSSKTAFQPQEYLMETLKQACKDSLKPWGVRSLVSLRDEMVAFIQKFNPSS